MRAYPPPPPPRSVNHSDSAPRPLTASLKASTHLKLLRILSEELTSWPPTLLGLKGGESVGSSAPSLSSVLPLITGVWCQQDVACAHCVGHFFLLDKWSGFLCALEPEVACWALNHRPSEVRCIQGAADKGVPPHSGRAVDLPAHCPLLHTSAGQR